MTAKLAQIAAHAGVSEATVSRVLNDKPGVAAATRECVLTAVDVLGYARPSNLRHAMVGLVGLIVPELTNPVFPLFAQTIQMKLAAENYTAMLCTQAPGGVQEDDYVTMLRDHGAAGIIYVSGRHADTEASLDTYCRLESAALPMVLINGHRKELSAPSLSTDDSIAVSLALDHLIALGHRRIGLATGQSRYVPSARKVAAFKMLAERHSLETAIVEQTWFTVEGGELAARHLLDAGITAILCGSDLMALGAIRAAEQRGLSVPHDISVVGFDGSPVLSFAAPPLTTVRQDVATISSAAVRALVDQMGGHPQPRGEALFAPELVVRGSTGRCP